jgi:hypothetical protein
MPKEPMLHYWTTSKEFASRQQWDEFVKWGKRQIAHWYVQGTPYGDVLSFYVYPSILVNYLKINDLSIYSFKIVIASDGYAECKEN